MNPLEELKVAQLKAILKGRGADTRGSKAALMLRLREILEEEGVDIESFVAAQKESVSSLSADRKADDTVVERPDHDVDSNSPPPGPLVRASSQMSVRSSASQISISSLRAAESATKAGLMARAAFLREKQKMEKEEMEMKMRKEELQLQMELAEVEARERALMEAETHPTCPTTETGPDVASALGIGTEDPKKRNGHAEEAVADVDEGLGSLRFDGEVSGERAGQLKSTGSPPRAPAATGQLDATQVILSQIQQSCLPKPELPVFKGDVTKYRSFIRAFDSRIGTKTDSDSERLFYLEQYCAGKPRDIIKGCLHMADDVGYAEARRLLERRYGDPDTISSAFVDMLMDWAQLKPGDVEGLDRFSLALTSCLNVMQNIPLGARETDHPRTMRKVVEKLPSYLQDSWRRQAHKIHEFEKRKVQFEDVVTFVDREVRIQTDPTFGRHREERIRKPAHTVSATAVAEDARDPRNCLYCQGSHFTDLCTEFRKLNFDQRQRFVRENLLCFGCLRKGHRYRSCFRKLNCKSCKRLHPTAMHKDNDTGAATRSGDVSQTQSTAVKNGRLAVSTSEVSAGTTGSSSAMMPIVPVRIWNEDRSRSVVAYAFLDMGSSATFCSPQLLNRLNMEGQSEHLIMTTATAENQRITCELVKGLKVSDTAAMNVIDLPPTYTLDRIPVDRKDTATSVDLERWPYLREVVPPEVDAGVEVLIGANCPQALTPLEVRADEEGCPVAIRTSLGWVVYGPRFRSQVREQTESVNRINVHRCTNDEFDLHNKFVSLYNQDFEHDRSSTDVGFSVEDRTWMQIVEGGIRHLDGRYQIPLPLKSETLLPDNKQQAEQRAEQLKRKLTKNEKYLKDYKKFVNDLIEKNYAERVKSEEIDTARGRTWYIPHHGVYHPMKPEKIRVVYDCSSTYRGISLNSRLLQGPNLTSSLLGVLLRFRERPVAVMADVEKMFYQVRVPDNDRSFLRFLWWPNGDTRQELEVYQMNVHLFGAISSPACANFALRRTAQDFGDMFGEDVKDSIQRSFYVDDFMRTGSTAEEVLKDARGVRDCCALGGFRLTGFVSNSSDVMLGLPEAECVTHKRFDMTDDSLPAQTMRALGVQWDVSEDTLSFRVDVRSGSATRRGILSTVSAVYDPLGFGAPFVMPAKVLLQDLCRLKLGWDDPVPDAHLKRWRQWCQELNDLREFSVPRSVTVPGKLLSCQLHMFADASESGYGAAGYIRVTDSTGTVRTTLLMSRARVAPLKTASIPRLELASAALAVQLSTQILSELDLNVDEVHFWTDSVSTLRYINNTTSRFQTFVSNRLSIIHDGSKPGQWKYVPSALNPADALSRGQSAREFLHSGWTTGPAFLSAPVADWPEQKHAVPLAEDVEGLEVKRSLVSSTIAERDSTSELLSSVSDWYKLKRRVAWWLRLKRILRKRLVNRGEGDVGGALLASPRLTVQELLGAEVAIVSYTQGKAFPEEMSGSVKKSSPLYRLNPCLTDGTLRVGGRLSNAAIPDAAKHQMILPKKGHVTDIIIRDMHEKKGHSGREHVLAALRGTYWIVNGNAAVRRVLSSCVRCRRIQGPVVAQKMADLPEDRTTPQGGVFCRVGVDYFGPFYVKVGRKQHKRFCALFTCLATHAIHIEVCDSLDTSSFINALRRFQARRGQVTFIRSDNGTNFVGAERELREEFSKLCESKVHDFLLQRGVEWQFNPPGASAQGGVWERQIRSIRKVLNAVLREQSLTDESLQTLLCEVEAVLNSKPLTTVSSDPSDLQPLTPNDLLLLRGGPVPGGVFSERDCLTRRRWKHVQYLADVFWKRWLSEYLPLLQIRQKWNKAERNLKVGDVVLIADVTTPRCRWPLGRVTEVFPDRKGFVRSVLVRTTTSVLKRPISKLVLVLESESTE